MSLQYRDELTLAIQAAQRRFQRWPTSSRARVLQNLLDDLRKYDGQLHESEITDLRNQIADLSERLRQVETFIAFRRERSGSQQSTAGRLA